MNRFLKNAQKILIGNRKRGYTLPTDNKLYPAQWNWDSAFIALGYSYFNLNFALKEIKTLLDGQWKDGMVPHILFHNTDTNYYPNHTAWNCGNKIHSSGITQPPVLASILKQIIDKNKITKKQIKEIKYYFSIYKSNLNELKSKEISLKSTTKPEPETVQNDRANFRPWSLDKTPCTDRQLGKRGNPTKRLNPTQLC